MADQVYTYTELFQCAEREVKIRRRVYNHRIFKGQMTKGLADSEIAKMEAIRDHFEELAKGERLI